MFGQPKVDAVLVLDAEGARIAAKYFDPAFDTMQKQLDLEQKVFQKTQRNNARIDADVLAFDDIIVLYKFCTDSCMYVVAKGYENQLIIASVLSAFEESLGELLRNQIDKTTLVNNLDLLLLVIDEIIDNGIILEIESSEICSRVSMRGAEKDMPLSEQTLSQAFQSARDQFVRSFR